MITPTPVHTAHECYCGLDHGLDGMTHSRELLGPEANAIYRALKKTNPNYIDIGEDYEYAALAEDIAANLDGWTLVRTDRLEVQPEDVAEPIGRIRRTWWRLGWLSAQAVARDPAPLSPNVEAPSR